MVRALDLEDPDLPPRGEVAVGTIVRSHVLDALARQGAGQLIVAIEVVAPVMKLNALAVARHGHIGRLSVHPRRRQDVHPIHRQALSLVESGGVTVIDVGVVLHVEGDSAALVDPHRQAPRVHVFDRAEGPVLDAEVPVIAQKHDPVADSEGSLAA